MATKKVRRTIYAKQKWQKTGVYVNQYDKVDVRYIGDSWTTNPAIGYFDANGTEVYKGKPGYVLKDVNEGALIGQIEGSIFAVGNLCHLPTTSNGELLLIINDDIDQQYGAGFDDNDGQIVVEIEYEFAHMTAKQLQSAE